VYLFLLELFYKFVLGNSIQSQRLQVGHLWVDGPLSLCHGTPQQDLSVMMIAFIITLCLLSLCHSMPQEDLSVMMMDF